MRANVSQPIAVKRHSLIGALRLLVIATTAFLQGSLSPRAASNRPPNILFFLVDDMGWQETSVPFHSAVTDLNRRYRTPSMERLAAEGMKFTQAYASAVCSPTRVSALTGMNAARHRVTNWTLRRDVSPDPKHPSIEPPAWNVNGVSPVPGIPRTALATPLPELLRRVGYRTIHVGKAHFGAQGTPGDNPLNLGFDVNIAGHAAGGPGSYHGRHDFSAAWRQGDRIWDVPGLEAYHGQDIHLTEALTREALSQLEKTVTEGKPFYLYMSHYAIHAPWEKDDRFWQSYRDAGLSEFNATYASMVEGMDKSLGDLLGALQRLGVATNTLVVFSSDNGSPKQADRNRPLRGHKLTPYEGGTRVPFLVKWPGVVTPGSLCRTPILIEDLFPTFLEIAGTPHPDGVVQEVDGISLVPLLRGEPPPAEPRDLVWHFPHTYDQPPYSAIRHGPWKLIYHHLDRRQELFQVEDDLSEATDLAVLKPDIRRQLADRLARELRVRGALMPLDKRTGETVPLPAP